jgi:hypothetical protein
MTNHGTLFRLGFESLDIGIYWSLWCLGFEISFRLGPIQVFSHGQHQPSLRSSGCEKAYALHNSKVCAQNCRG